jgi:hypothetical protein
VRITGFFDLFDIDMATFHVYYTGGATFDNRHHPARHGVHFHDCHNLARPLHSSDDPGLRVLFPFTEHQL